MNKHGLYGAVPLSHFFLRERLVPGDRAIDATCGNGQDTLLLAKHVGPEGKVWAFDVQEGALFRTRSCLETAGLADRVSLVHAGHERMTEFVAEPVKAILFNLGYLPTGEREIKTSAASTLAALRQGEKLLLPSGIILVAVYTGHDGGEAEWAAVNSWAAALSPQEYNVWLSRQLNRSEKAPFLVMAEKVL
jgi:predicted methyltransferase